MDRPPLNALTLESLGALRKAMGDAAHAIDDPMFGNIIDVTVEPAELLPAARSRAWQLVAMPGFARVKAQYRRATRARG